MERTLGAVCIRPLIDDAAVRELPVCEPDGYLLTGSGASFSSKAPGITEKANC